MATATSIQYVQKIFIAYLGRGASTEALTYWADQIDANGEAGKDALFYDLWNSAEGKALYDGKTQDQIINQIYQNSFERDAKQAGLDHYKAELAAGNINVVSMAAVIVDSADETGAAVFGYKTQAADYYRTEVDEATSKSFVATESKNAVNNVDGPVTLAASKDSTDALISGVGIDVTLTTASDAAKLVMTLGNDLVNGTVGTGATYQNATDVLVDSSTTDSDSLTLTGDAGFTFGTVTNVEAVNVNLAKQTGGAFTLAGVNNVTGSSTINVDVADTVTIAGVSVTGETDLVLTGGLATDVSTADVKTLQATLATGTAEKALTITGDVDLATVNIESVADSATNLVLADNDATVKFSGTAATNDAASVSTSGKVAIDVSDDVAGSDPEGIEKLTLEGNGGALVATITGVAAAKSDVADMVYTTTGSQAVTLKGAVTQFAGAALTQSGTGATGVNLTTVDSFDFSTWGVLGGGITLGADAGANADTFKLAAGTDVTYTVAQNAGAAQTFDANDTATNSSITINANVNVGELLFEDFETIAIATNDSAAITIDEITSANNDATVSVVGANDITLTGTLETTGDTTISGKKLSIGGATDVGGTGTKAADLELTATDDIATAALVVSNDITITAANDITITGGSNANKGSMIVNGDDFDGTGLTDAQNDITITVTNDVDLDGVTSSDGSVSITGATIDNATTAITVSKGNVTLTATNDAATSTVNTAITTKTLTLADGKFTNAGAAVEWTADNVVISGDTDVLDSDFVTPSVAITSTNDVTIGTINEKTAGEGFVIAGSGASGKISVTTDSDATTAGTATIYTGSGADTVTADDADTTFVISTGGNATTETINMDNFATGSVVNSGDGDDVIDIDETTAGVLTIDAGAGNDTVNLVDSVVTGTFDLGAGTADKVVLQEAGGVTYTALGLKNIEELDITAGAATFTWSDLAGNDTTFELTGGQTLTITGAATAETINLTGITPNTLAIPNVTVNAGDGNDVITANADTVTTINGQGGTDNITGGDAGDTLTGGTGGDTITGGKGADTINGEAGSDTIILTEATSDNDVVTLGADLDTLTGFTRAEDHIKFDISDIEGTVVGAVDLVTSQGVSLADTNAVVLQDITAATDLDGVNGNLLHISGTYASTGALESALEIGGVRQLTAGASGDTEALAALDTFMVIYDDGTNTYLAAVTTTAGADDTTFAVGDLTVTVIAKINGEDDADAFVVGDFEPYGG